MTLQNLNYKQFCDVASTEAQRIIEQTQLDAAKNSTERNRLGQFATPNTLAIEIINYSKTLLPPDRKIRFLDPAIGMLPDEYEYAYGWNEKGERLHSLKSGRRQGRVNMISAYCDHKLIAPFTVEGACT